jgi:hypothetical protein
MAEITNPRAGGASSSYYGLTGDAARQAQINVEMFNLKKIIDGNKPSSAKYKNALEKYNALRDEKTALEDKAKKALATKEQKKKRDALIKAEEDLQRAKDTKDAGKQKNAQEDVDRIKEELSNTQDDVVASGYLGSGTKDKPLMLDGENYSGSYKGKTYKNGILVKETPAAVKDDNKKKGTGKVEDEPGQDIKQLWTSYLRSTFATLEDKTQKAEIDGLLKRAKTEKWDEDLFMTALEGTVWWQTTLPSMRQFFLDTHDKRNASTFAEKMKNTMDSMLGKLETLGIQVKQVDPTTGRVTDNSDYLKGIAMKSIENGWDDDQLEQYLSTQGSIVFSGGGTLGSYYDRVAQQAFLYGVPLDATMKQTINTSLLDPMDGRDVNYWLKTVKDMAYDAPQNKAFLPALQQGRNLYEVTNSYRQQMASLLEVDSTAITWNDLMGKVIDGNTGNARTFSDFTKQLKQDPLWQVTRNAKETYSNTALDIAKMFGFMG